MPRDRDGSDHRDGADRRARLDSDRLARALAASYDAGAGERRAVVRQARDLADADRYRRDQGHALTAEELVGHLADAPHDGLAASWNWWLGALETAYGGYATFQVRRFAADAEAHDGDPPGEGDAAGSDG